MKNRIAYIDDNLSNRDSLSVIFRNDFPVETFADPSSFLEQFSSSSFACILADVKFPTMSGFDLYELTVEHPNYNGCPILFVSSDVSSFDKVKSFELGAVDFMDRGISPEEMVARVKSKILFYQKHRHLIEFDGLKINLTQLKTYVKGIEVPLTFIELKILCLVIRNYPDVVSKKEVVRQVWKNGQVLDSTIYTHLSNLKGKIREWGYEVQSIKSRGIQLLRSEESK